MGTSQGRLRKSFVTDHSVRTIQALGVPSRWFSSPQCAQIWETDMWLVSHEKMDVKEELFLRAALLLPESRSLVLTVDHYRVCSCTPLLSSLLPLLTHAYYISPGSKNRVRPLLPCHCCLAQSLLCSFPLWNMWLVSLKSAQSGLILNHGGARGPCSSQERLFSLLIMLFIYQWRWHTRILSSPTSPGALKDVKMKNHSEMGPWEAPLILYSGGAPFFSYSFFSQ